MGYAEMGIEIGKQHPSVAKMKVKLLSQIMRRGHLA